MVATAEILTVSGLRDCDINVYCKDIELGVATGATVVVGLR